MYKMALLHPFTRAELQSYKEDSKHASKIQVANVVEYIYNQVVKTAKSTDVTSYNYSVPRGSSFYKENIPTIMDRLKNTFPGCAIKHTLLARGTDGKLYDIGKFEEAVLPKLDRVLEESYIVVDWS